MGTAGGGGGGGGGSTCDTSQELTASNFMCVNEPPEGAFVLGTQIFVNGKQSTLDPSAVITVTLSALGVVLATEHFQLPLTDGTITLGGPTDTLGLTLAALESGTLEVMIQASSAVLATFDISGVTIRVCFSVPGCDFDWIGTFEQQDSDLLTLALDSCGVFWQEDVINDPNVLVPFYPNILPNTFAVGVTEDDREFIALSNLQSGTDMPRQYDGTNLDRISQVGPGAPPQVTFRFKRISHRVHNAGHDVHAHADSFCAVELWPNADAYTWKRAHLLLPDGNRHFRIDGWFWHCCSGICRFAIGNQYRF